MKVSLRLSLSLCNYNVGGFREEAGGAGGENPLSLHRLITPSSHPLPLSLMRMIEIPAGCFERNNSIDALDSGFPVHQVTLRLTGLTTPVICLLGSTGRLWRRGLSRSLVVTCWVGMAQSQLVTQPLFSISIFVKDLYPATLY